MSEGVTELPVKDGRLKFSVTPQLEGDLFVVRVMADGAVTDLTLTGSRDDYDWGSIPRESSVSRTPKPMRPTAVTINAPKMIRAGQSFAASFKSPYRGRALVTLETHRVVHARWIDVRPGTNIFRTGLKQFAPNAYVSVFIVKDPHLESKRTLIPGGAFGTLSVTVEPKAFTETVRIEVPDEVRPHQTLSVKLKLGRSKAKRFVSVAAVDEGIL